MAIINMLGGLFKKPRSIKIPPWKFSSSNSMWEAAKINQPDYFIQDVPRSVRTASRNRIKRKSLFRSPKI
jgi:hypothetical protein